MTDEELIERLRKLADDMRKHATKEWDENELVDESSDRIEELRRRVLIAESKVVTMQIGIREILEKWASPIEKRGMN